MNELKSWNELQPGDIFVEDYPGSIKCLKLSYGYISFFGDEFILGFRTAGMKYWLDDKLNEEKLFIVEKNVGIKFKPYREE